MNKELKNVIAKSWLPSDLIQQWLVKWVVTEEEILDWKLWEDLNFDDVYEKDWFFYGVKYSLQHDENDFKDVQVDEVKQISLESYERVLEQKQVSKDLENVPF